MKKLITKNNLIRLIYIFCFYMFCWIDQICGSRNGRIQMVAVNSIGFFVAIIIFSNFKLKDFLKWEYLVWLIICLIGTPIQIRWGMSNYNYPGQWTTAILEGAVYGFIIIRLVKYYYGEKHKIYEHFDKWALIMIGAIFVLMVISRNESIWYVYYFMVFGSLMLTPMTAERHEILSDSMSTGVIFGYIMIQGHAFVFRPYDIVRYNGFYTNPNINSLLYVAGFVAILCKIYKLKSKNSKLVWRLLMYAFAGLTVGFAVYTGCRTALLTIAVVYFAFMIKYVSMIPKKKINRIMALSVLMVAMIVAMIYPAYCAIRYIPPVFHHPVWLDGDTYSEERVHSWDEWDSEKYVSFDDAIEESGIRVFKTFVHAETIEKMNEESGSSSDNPLFSIDDEKEKVNMTSVRIYIYKWYVESLNLWGHEKDDGVWITYCNHHPHAHNVFLQIGYDFGIPMIGMVVVFLILYVVHSIKTKKDKINVLFCLAFFLFGSIELSWGRGQLLYTLLFWAIKDNFDEISAIKNKVM